QREGGGVVGHGLDVEAIRVRAGALVAAALDQQGVRAGAGDGERVDVAADRGQEQLVAEWIEQPPVRIAVGERLTVEIELVTGVRREEVEVGLASLRELPVYGRAGRDRDRV